MNSYTVDELRATLTARRDAMTAALAALDLAFATLPAATPLKARRVVRRGKVRRAARAKRQGGTEQTLSADPLVRAREEAILFALQRNDGIATTKVLRAAMPKEPDLTDEQRLRAFGNCVHRLRQKGLIGRTGDTWSQVGLEAAR